MCGDGVSLHYGYQLSERLLQYVTALPLGQYLLVHRAGSAMVLCYQALPEPLQIAEVCIRTLTQIDAGSCICTQVSRAQMRGLDLNVDSDHVSSSDVFDLHAPHQRSYATDTTTLPFVPLGWKPFNDHIVQVISSAHHAHPAVLHPCLCCTHVSACSVHQHMSCPADPIHVPGARQRCSEANENTK